MNRILYLVIPIFFFLAACENGNYLSTDQQTVNPLGWEYKDSLNFDFEIKDTTLLYSILLDIEHNTDFPYQNIYFRIATTFPSGTRLEQQLSSDLADKSGAWHGKCSGRDCLAPINLQETAKFNEIGKHTISITQFTRDSALVGVHSLNLKLAEFKTKSK